MAKGKIARKAHKDRNKNFLIALAKQEGINTLDERVLYRIERAGDGERKPQLEDVVSVHYKGSLIDGREFDSSLEQPYPETFRMREVIEGWQIALQQMVVGDKWTIYLPYNVGYGDRAHDNIPAFSTLIFEVELLSIS